MTMSELRGLLQLMHVPYEAFQPEGEHQMKLVHFAQRMRLLVLELSQVIVEADQVTGTKH